MKESYSLVDYHFITWKNWQDSCLVQLATFDEESEHYELELTHLYNNTVRELHYIMSGLMSASGTLNTLP